ncbi:uncharacterized protein BHQ10_007530 [Talaromyces amestolkiae]|uniref:RelA/SpoT domain-containing protein n=1 Tax=Talaromyces amestolkiae TaxID=1196081 RepID=A0A364L6S4_TALAM|nr:uncharacterized protein BHQ10_007530 [Talaromyces amestolkiae]RAO71518.1 hypothetical protein BHQ10_007530 [Talaromyces amestolkiae]
MLLVMMRGTSTSERNSTGIGLSKKQRPENESSAPPKKKRRKYSKTQQDHNKLAAAPVQASKISLIDDFIKLYENEGYMAYAELSTRSKGVLSRELSKSGIKYEIFDRGEEGFANGLTKAPSSVRRSLSRRQNSHGQYESMNEIISDMHDLAAIRVAVYYPNDFNKVENIINRCFEEAKPPQDWPDLTLGPFPYPKLDNDISAQNDILGRNSRFPGYFARHFRVRLKENSLTDKVLEIQVMSLLMHAWSKIHHELIYKPRLGVPQADEDDERLIDTLNGNIIACEQILRQIQINHNRKKEQAGSPFGNEHKAWDYLESKWLKRGKSERIPVLSKVSLLEGHRLQRIFYQSLKTHGFNTPEMVDKLVKLFIDYYGEKNETGRSHSTFPKTRHFFSYLIRSLANLDHFKKEEYDQLKLPETEANNLKLSETAKLVRYRALIICNAFKYDDLNYSRINLDKFSGKRPSRDEFLMILHPQSTLQFNPQCLTALNDFCQYLLNWDDKNWQLGCAISRLTNFRVKPDQNSKHTIPAREFSFTECPWSLINLLDGPAEYRNQPQQDLVPQSVKYGRKGTWGTRAPIKPQNDFITLGFPAVRLFLDRLDSM